MCWLRAPVKQTADFTFFRPQCAVQQSGLECCLCRPNPCLRCLVTDKCPCWGGNTGPWFDSKNGYRWVPINMLHRNWPLSEVFSKPHLNPCCTLNSKFALMERFSLGNLLFRIKREAPVLLKKKKKNLYMYSTSQLSGIVCERCVMLKERIGFSCSGPASAPDAHAH